MHRERQGSQGGGSEDVRVHLQWRDQRCPLPFAYVPYSKMKVGVEDAIKELDFEHAIILRPGMILGREKPKNALLENVFANLNKLGQGIQDKIGMTNLINTEILDTELVTCSCGSNHHR